MTARVYKPRVELTKKDIVNMIIGGFIPLMSDVEYGLVDGRNKWNRKRLYECSDRFLLNLYRTKTKRQEGSLWQIGEKHST